MTATDFNASICDDVNPTWAEDEDAGAQCTLFDVCRVLSVCLSVCVCLPFIALVSGPIRHVSCITRASTTPHSSLTPVHPSTPPLDPRR